MHVDSKTTHPIKFMPELTCKSKVSLDCLKKVKIIKDLQMQEKEKNTWYSRGDGEVVLEQNLSLWESALEMVRSRQLL